MPRFSRRFLRHFCKWPVFAFIFILLFIFLPWGWGILGNRRRGNSGRISQRIIPDFRGKKQPATRQIHQNFEEKIPGENSRGFIPAAPKNTARRRPAAPKTR
ncbi:MAG: hypothetical protein MPK11_07075, partial [Gammaproteobacteria bacterium]|nr:hypothetical protein [Gammaproteobacteria bacterium]